MFSNEPAFVKIQSDTLSITYVVGTDPFAKTKLQTKAKFFNCDVYAP